MIFDVIEVTFYCMKKNILQASRIKISRVRQFQTFREDKISRIRQFQTFREDKISRVRQFQTFCEG